MKLKLLSVGMALGIFFLAQTASQAQTNMDEFLAKWEGSMQFTMDVVDKMPEDLLDYKPHESAMSFQEQIVHLSNAAVGMSQQFLGGPDAKSILESKPSSKEELKAHVKLSYEYAMKVFKSVPEDQLGDQVEIYGNTGSKRQVMGFIDDHTIHHRGAAISYIRANGVEPPRYRMM